MIFNNIEIEYDYHFQMDITSVKQGRVEPCKIYFTEKTFGKPTKNRREDPNMFELLAWDVDGFEKHCFKRDEKFKESTGAYMNMIGKNPWTSEAQENFVNYHDHCIAANPQVLHKIENYIDDRLPNAEKDQRPSPAKKAKDHKLALPDEKKENKYHPSHYQSPKGISAKNIQEPNPNPKSNFHDVTSPKANRLNSVADQNKSSKKIRMEEKPREEKMEGQHVKQTGGAKYYGQSLEKSKVEEPEISQNDQQKLIENFKQTTRWIPNSAFTTYFGKPPFENYGRGNTHPIDGGLVYGTYLYSHNVHPHRGGNNPKNIQSYPVALMKAKSQGTLVPMHPRTKPDYSNDLLNSNAEIDHRSKIEPQLNNFLGALDIEVPVLSEMQKFGGKRKTRTGTQFSHA